MRTGRKFSPSSIDWGFLHKSYSRKHRRSHTRRRRLAAATRRKNETHMAALIEAKDLTKKYGAHVALDRANLHVEAGRIVGLIGPNGAGKTSALRAILG